MHFDVKKVIEMLQEKYYILKLKAKAESFIEYCVHTI